MPRGVLHHKRSVTNQKENSDFRKYVKMPSAWNERSSSLAERVALSQRYIPSQPQGGHLESATGGITYIMENQQMLQFKGLFYP